ncbi:hypothetical protein KIH74_13045 [Kineosporia sp. J2-2]|uniref:Bulb-type lectin domain-containing protein n=1 Tax=Kineosporia corallincola TaxID=2835133 RepID=A0ABS5TFK4_9ACTN|nr:hypothetical protein [Kineosporia corallincola]MBT0769857.1 hypothetical protein [Kineosporia corallincola]
MRSSENLSPSPNRPDELRLGEYLHGTSISSRSGRFAFQNVRGAATRLYDNASGAVLWTVPDDRPRDSSSFVVGLDGDLVVRNRSRLPVWRAATAGLGGVVLRLTDSGELELLDEDGRKVWGSGTAGAVEPLAHSPIVFGWGSVLRRGQSLRHQSLVSPDGLSVLAHTERGVSFFVTGEGDHWAHADDRPGSALELGLDGVLRLRAGEEVLHEFGGPAEELQVWGRRAELVQADGDVVWATPAHVRYGQDPGDRLVRNPPHQAVLERRFMSLAPDHGYTVAVVKKTRPDEVLRRWDVQDVSVTTWQRLQASRPDGQVPVAAVPLGDDTLLMAGAPWLPGERLSTGTTVARESYDALREGWPQEWALHADGRTVAHVRQAYPRIRMGVTRPDVEKAAQRVDVPTYLQGSVDWLAVWAGLELTFRAAGVCPEVGDLNGEMLGGFVAASLARPPRGPQVLTPPGRAPLPELDFLLVRTDFSDDAEWDALLRELTGHESFGDAEEHPVNDRSWEGASLDEVMAAVPNPEQIPAVHIADSVSMTGRGHPVLTVSTSIPAASETYEPDENSPRSIRVAADSVWTVHANLEIANMDWEEFVPDPDGPDPVYRDS